MEGSESKINPRGSNSLLNGGSHEIIHLFALAPDFFSFFFLFFFFSLNQIYFTGLPFRLSKLSKNEKFYILTG